MLKKYDYCVAIRTLGTAGEKYQKLLDSIKEQTIQPKHIFVYIAEGYALPKETIDIEEYIRTPKGMITQRSQPFDEIDTEYVLFCDDDLYLPPDCVERMFEGLEKKNGDCIALGIYELQQLSKKEKLMIFLHNFVTSRNDDGWDVKVKRNVSYSFNNQPQSNILRTQSAAGACCLCKKNVYQEIHYEDERWMENMSYAAGDDQLFYYKMHIMGYRVLLLLNSGVIHLDAQAGQRPTKSNKMYLQKKNMFIMWYRTIYNIQSKNWWEKCRCVAAFSWRCLFGILTLPLEVIHYKQPRFFIDYFRGLWAGYKYVHSEEYEKIPSFDYYMY